MLVQGGGYVKSVLPHRGGGGGGGGRKSDEFERTYFLDAPSPWIVNNWVCGCGVDLNVPSTYIP